MSRVGGVNHANFVPRDRSLGRDHSRCLTSGMLAHQRVWHEAKFIRGISRREPRNTQECSRRTRELLWIRAGIVSGTYRYSLEFLPNPKSQIPVRSRQIPRSPSRILRKSESFFLWVLYSSSQVTVGYSRLQ